MEYLLVQAQGPTHFTDKVNVAISRGFEPVGGVALQFVSTLTDAHMIYAQAMVKPDRVDYDQLKFDEQNLSKIFNALQESK